MRRMLHGEDTGIEFVGKSCGIACVRCRTALEAALVVGTNEPSPAFRMSVALQEAFTKNENAQAGRLEG